MFNKRFFKIFAAVNLFLILLIFADFFILPDAQVVDVYENIVEERSRTSITRSYTSVFIVGKSGARYQIPESYYDLGINGSSEFYVFKSPIFRINKSVVFLSGESNYSLNIGPFNSRLVVPFVFGAFALYFLVALIRGYRNESDVYSAIFVSAVWISGVVMMIFL
mgnify:CR=1 FL=1